MKYSRVKVNCTECQREYHIRKYLILKPTKNGRFCSQSCKSKFYARIIPSCQPRKIKTKCGYCGLEIELQPYRIGNINFCSNSCRGKYGLSIRWADGPKIIDIHCSFCKTLLKFPAQIYNSRKKRNQETFFCGRKCFSAWKAAHWIGESNPSWKGGWTPHGTGWRAACEIVRHEQNYICEDCKITENELGRSLDVHHKKPARLFKTKKESSFRENLVGLCHRCHMAREHLVGE